MAGRTGAWRACGPLLLLLLCAAPAAADEPGQEGVDFFERKVRPLFVRHCYSCHSAEAPKVRGGLRLDSREAILKGGKSGPAVVPGAADKGLLLRAVGYADAALKMPPKAPLSAEEVADLAAWVKMGAPVPAVDPPPRLDVARARAAWPFRPVEDRAPPPVKDTAWPAGPIDRFLLAKLEEKGLRPAPPADKRVLLRRATYDLTGLPPTPQEIDAFLKDDSPDAFPKVVERLLASPGYGERWGRHWLDVVRYADTAGDNSDYPIPQMYRYRDWVIKAFNDDKPYDQFVREQIAGDLLPAANDQDRYDKIVATGYLANSHRFGSYEDARYPWNLTIDDTID